MRRDGGIAADGGGAGNENRIAFRSRHDRGAGETGRPRAVVLRVVVGGNLQRVLYMARQRGTGGEDDGQGTGLGTDRRSGGQQLLEARAVVLLKGQGTCAAEEA